ncbi:period circadian protein isoform X3 [Plodia interpunctella]|uniref:period circadian protein isoform X3 n=1 Tax=Plodia interpunctella TaxID=58824 RepID=UPI002368842E|nr:period circadian protein isoform X3 [Plodia interpunctella]
MDNLLLDSENNAKISDSAYSNSCSNSQSRRSHSSKSTHSGSNSSGSSGYGGKPSTSGSSNAQQPEKRTKDKDTKKKKSQAETLQTPIEEECRPPTPVAVFEDPKEEKLDVELSPPTQHVQSEKGVELMEIVASDRISDKDEEGNKEGFSCVISMHDGVVMYTTSTLTTTLGFPKDMWIGRSFIDFVHPRDRNIFASQITNGLAVPKVVNGTQEKAQSPGSSTSTMVCRIRRYRGLNAGFGVKERLVTFLPFLLKLTFKDISDDKGKVIYLVIQATPFFSAFKLPNEPVTKSVPFVLRHAANGQIEYIDPESVPYLGYLPQDLTGKNALNLYHPEELGYLGHVYETIVKEGGMPRSKPYRMMTQNGDYLRLETEWSSFINPWSRKLEFVTGKHYIIEGPSNPDVLQTSESEKSIKQSEEEKNKTQGLRDSIIRILNEVLTKPAEVAKQQMSKRCQDLASFMESLMEEPPKGDDEFRLEIQEPDNSYYERDSVMFGGISPHHEYNDSKSSTETPLSYNQLNYNETLQRYFDSHESFYHEEFNTSADDNLFVLNKIDPSSVSSPAVNSGDSGEMSSYEGSTLAIGNCATSTIDDCHPHRLTESLLSKHNAEMEKELMKMHRDSRSTKGDREKVSNDTRKKKKEHLARCNASFQPTAAGTISDIEPMPHGVKRNKQADTCESVPRKHHCPNRSSRRKHVSTAHTLPATNTITTTQAVTQWPPAPMNNMNAFILGVGIPQQMSIINPLVPQQMAPMPAGMFPMYYAPATAAAPIPSTSSEPDPNKPTGQQFQGPPMQCMMYGQAMYGSAFMYSPIAPQVSYPVQQTAMAAMSMQQSNSLNPLGLTSRNYEEACKPGLQLRSSKITAWRDKKRADSNTASSKLGQGSGESCSSTNGHNRSTDALPDIVASRAGISKSNRLANSDEAVDRTDGESSYSSFYSSFFKTESGSAEDSGGTEKKSNKFWNKNRPGDQTPEDSYCYKDSRNVKKMARRKMEPPWVEQVCVTSELIYKYQILTKTMDEVLTADQQKINNLEQPTLVNEQLGQLYLDLQLEGVAARLTLEEGITSSSSSGEETVTSQTKTPRRKREYSKLVMIYEEDAPLPPSPPEDEPTAGTSSAP